MKITFSIIMLVAVLSSAVRAEEITSAVITESAMACEDCVEWRVSGICFWITCTIFGCDIDTSVRVSHYIPDFVVTSYSGANSPWKETQTWNTNKPTVITHRNREAGDTHADFKKVDVIGNPAAYIFESMNSSGYFCKSCITGFKPYFVSDLDRKGWNAGIPEMFYLDSLLGRRVMGKATVRFGNIFPRIGWTVHAEDPKSAALTAQRAADLVTSRDRAPRVYLEAERDCGNKCWPPPPVKENDIATHKWQMLTPVKQSRGEIFGQRSGWANGKYTTSEQYAWNLWRPYSCCEPAGAAFLYAVTW